jgi:hypothetical protein
VRGGESPSETGLNCRPVPDDVLPSTLETGCEVSPSDGVGMCCASHYSIAISDSMTSTLARGLPFISLL